MPNAVDQMVEAAGGKGKLSRELGVSFQALFQWSKTGWMPLSRAKQAIDLYPGVAPLRDLVKPDLRQAMDISAGQTLLD